MSDAPRYSEEEARNTMVATLRRHDWIVLTYEHFPLVMCPVCGAAIGRDMTMRIIHEQWHERGNYA